MSVRSPMKEKRACRFGIQTGGKPWVASSEQFPALLETATLVFLGKWPMKIYVNMLGGFTTAKNLLSWLVLVAVTLSLQQPVQPNGQYSTDYLAWSSSSQEGVRSISIDLLLILGNYCIHFSLTAGLNLMKVCSYLFSRDSERTFRKYTTCQTCFMLFEVWLGSSLLLFTAYSFSLLLNSTHQPKGQPLNEGIHILQSCSFTRGYSFWITHLFIYCVVFLWWCNT